jgi:hypothetical protein
MNIEEVLAKTFGLDDERWFRHANPISVYSRYTVLPSVVISVWSRVWIGQYFLIPLVLAIVWTFLNPRLFSKPESMDSWASKSVLGERIWKERSSYGIPRRKIIQVRILNLIQVLGLPPLVWGLYTLNFWMMMTGFVLLTLAKSWFLDRMVWLFEQHKENETVRGWLE